MKQRHPQTGEGNRYGIALILCVVVMIGDAIFGVSLVSPSEEMARARNSFIASVGEYAEFTWSPDQTPESFLLEQGAVPEEFLPIQAQLKSETIPGADNWQRALSVARHLSKGPGRGDGIMSNTYDAYKKIMTEKQGYCADYTQVFNGLAYLLDVPVREWGVAFDGFGGNGHAFSEVYDDNRGKWIFLDSFYSFYVEDATTHEPLSLLEFRRFLQGGGDGRQVKVTPVVAERFGFKSGEKALEYYKNGADQFYLWWGNNVFSYDKNFFVEMFGPISRALEEGAAILLGIRPKIKIIGSATNSEAVDILFAKRRLILLCAIVFFAAGLAAVALFAKRRGLFGMAKGR
jgi:hypothetical protein